MATIHVLDDNTINKIAAGEVIERPSAVVKELVENAIDAKSTAITVEIKEGGLSLIRVTDNGLGISKDDVKLAFLRHATSKIHSVEDLFTVVSLGFRGEALSSIASVAQVELITKTPSSLSGTRYCIEGGVEKAFEEVGSPNGTTFLVRNLFFNTPARRKFLKTPTTEAGYIEDFMERAALSHPEISFKFIHNNNTRIQTSGSSQSKDILFQIYGREIVKEIVPVSYETEDVKISGYIGKPIITRGNRNFENYFINGRYIKSSIINKAIEEAYKPYLMQHKYPFTALNFSIKPDLIDVNVHPQKLELRIRNQVDIFDLTRDAIRQALEGSNMIPEVTLHSEEKKPVMEEAKSMHNRPAEPFEFNRRQNESNKTSSSGRVISGPVNVPLVHAKEEQMSTLRSMLREESEYIGTKAAKPENSNSTAVELSFHVEEKADCKVGNAMESRTEYKEANQTVNRVDNRVEGQSGNQVKNQMESQTVRKAENQEEKQQAASFLDEKPKEVAVQQTLDIAEPFLSPEGIKEHKIIGQLFKTYWLVEYDHQLYIIDQHAAHEKVLYEKNLKAVQEKTALSQQLLIPIVLTLNLREQEVINKYADELAAYGFEIEPFGGNEYNVRGVPVNLTDISKKELLLEFIDSLVDETYKDTPDIILEKIASMSCKAAVKANHKLSDLEVKSLIKDLLSLENPFHCPHGRPVIVSMTQYEIEKKFKRIV